MPDISQPQLTILIISWNCWDHLNACLSSISKSSFTDFEIIVIDNASVDGTGEKLKFNFPNVHFYQNDKNIGHTRAVNQGFKLVRGEHILILDADTELYEDTISQLMEFIVKQPDVTLVTPRAYYADGTIQETARNFPSVSSGLFGRQSLLARLFPNNIFTRRYLGRSNIEATGPFVVKQIAAACMLLPRALLDVVGDWDEGYGGYWVDTDWCMEVNKKGGRIYCLPGASFIHHENNKRGKKKSTLRIILFHRGAVRLYRKHYTLGYIDPRLLVALVALSLRALLLIITNSCRSSKTDDNDVKTLETNNKY